MENQNRKHNALWHTLDKEISQTRKPFKSKSDQPVRLDKNKDGEWITDRPPQVGDTITIRSSAVGGWDYTSGIYLLDTGQVITCKGGVITQVTTKRK